MRFLISISVIAALALLPAMAQAFCPADQQLKEKSDTNLPVWGLEYFISSCNSVDFDFYFTRTATLGTRAIIPNIVGTNMSEELPASEWSAGAHSIDGTGTVTGGQVQLRIDISDGSDTGLFSDMQLDAHFYNQ